MRIEYLQTVTSPPDQCGNRGDIKTVSDYVGRQLVKGGFAIKAQVNQPSVKVKGKKDVDKEADSSGK